MARLREEYNLSQKEIAKVTGKSKADVSKFLALRDKVAPDVQDLARLEVEIAKFHNRASLAKQLVNKLRRLTLTSLQEVAVNNDRDDECPRCN